jgi:hypothetical protein
MNEQQQKEQYSGVRDQGIRAALDQHWAVDATYRTNALVSRATSGLRSGE